MNKRTGRHLQKFLLALAIMMGLLAMAPMAAQAKTIKLKNCKFTTSVATAKKAAKTVKKGNTKVVLKGGHGYLKFKAPATRKYTFKYSNYVSTDPTGYAYIMEPYGLYGRSISMMDVSTKGGKTKSIWVCTANWWSRNGDSNVQAYTALRSRTAKVKLKKGQTYYLYFSAGAGAKINLSIK